MLSICVKDESNNLELVPLSDGYDIDSGAWWLSGRFGALHPEDFRFESLSSQNIVTLGKFFNRSCL